MRKDNTPKADICHRSNISEQILFTLFSRGGKNNAASMRCFVKFHHKH